jgi:hypothetical protein
MHKVMGLHNELYDTLGPKEVSGVELSSDGERAGGQKEEHVGADRGKARVDRVEL